MSAQVQRAETTRAAMTRSQVDGVLARMKTSSVFMWLPLSGMKFDPRVQRLLRPTWVKKHVPRFNADQIGTIVVSLRRDGTAYVLDGQHRVELLRAVKWGDQSVYCEVFKDITLEEEADDVARAISRCPRAHEAYSRVQEALDSLPLPHPAREDIESLRVRLTAYALQLGSMVDRGVELSPAWYAEALELATEVVE